MVQCHSWEYNMTDSLGNTWSSEWNLVCDKKYLKIVAEMIFLIGVATGGLVSGMLSDKFGRKKMLFISAVFQSFFGKYFDSFSYMNLHVLCGLCACYISINFLSFPIFFSNPQIMNIFLWHRQVSHYFLWNHLNFI
jgi:OCT family organic cation transporter-like MFS transporter 4/5